MRMSLPAAVTAVAMASGAMIGQATAADLDFAPAPAPLAPTWEGFYIGGHIGYGETKFDFRQDLDWFDSQGNPGPHDTFRASESPGGLVGGVQAGYNWQINALVLGIEGDISFTDWGEGTNVFDADFDHVNVLDPGNPGADAFGAASGNADFLASVRGRLGWAFGNMMVYGTGGVAWAEADASATMVVDDGVTATTFKGKGGLDDVGLVAGGGASWMVIPQTFSVGVEGLHYWFDESTTLINNSTPFEDGDLDVRATAELHNTWVVRARADFHF